MSSCVEDWLSLIVLGTLVRIAESPVMVDCSLTVGDLAFAVLKTEGDRFAMLAGNVRQTQDSEAIHQMRVAARRLRAALKCFEDILPKTLLEIDSDLRWVFHALGGVRDSDVLMKDVLATCPATAAREHLVEELRAKRLQAWNLLEATLRSERYEALAKALSEAPAQRGLKGKSQKLAVVIAPRLVGDQKDQVWKLVQRLDGDMSRAEIHELRKRAKRFRYTLEFFAEPYQDRSRRMLKRLKKLQDQLGAYVDASFAGKAMDDLLKEERAEGQTKALVEDLIEVFAERRDKALEALPESDANLSDPWRKLKKEMAKVKREARTVHSLERTGVSLKIVASR